MSDFWTHVQWIAMLPVVVRRSLTIRTRFEPTRLGRQLLRVAYELAVPIRRVRVRDAAPETTSAPLASPVARRKDK